MKSNVKIKEAEARNDEVTTLTFKKRDFLYDNGLVNFCIYLSNQEGVKVLVEDEEWEWDNVKVILSMDSLSIEGTEKNIKTLFDAIRDVALQKYLYETDKFRLWWDQGKREFICAKKTSSLYGNDNINIQKKNSIPITDTGYTFEELEILAEELKGKYIKEYGKIFDTASPLFWNLKKEPKIYCYFDLKSARKQIIDGKTKQLSKKCNICSNRASHIFNSDVTFYETGGDRFTDKLYGGNKYLCENCYLIYSLSNNLNYYFNSSSKFSYILHHDLILLYLLKKKIFSIKTIKIENKKNGKSFDSNIPFQNYFFSPPVAYAQTLSLIFSLYDLIKEAKVYDEVIDVDFKAFKLHLVQKEGIFFSNYLIFTRIDRLFVFFDKLHDASYQLQNENYHSSFKVLTSLLININQTNKVDKSNSLINEFCRNLINFNKNLINIIMENANNALKNSSTGVFDIDKFVEAFQDEINSTNKEKLLHKISALIGKKVGKVAHETDSKDLLYRIREIGNIRGFSSFFEEFSYRVLKHENQTIYSEFKEKEEAFLQALDISNWKEARAYLSIYAINQYLSSENKKSKGNK